MREAPETYSRPEESPQLPPPALEQHVVQLLATRDRQGNQGMVRPRSHCACLPLSQGASGWSRGPGALLPPSRPFSVRKAAPVGGDWPGVRQLTAGRGSRRVRRQGCVRRAYRRP